MSAAGFIERLTGVLEEAGIASMVTGSFASSVYGEPRTTRDIDLVVEVERDSLARLLAALPEDRYYVSESAAADALRARGMFNVIDFDTGWKADLFVRKERPFSRAEFKRRRRDVLLGVPVGLASPEDVIVAKLEWAQKGGGSQRQLADAAAIVRLNRTRLDLAYVEGWVAQLGLLAEWAAVS